MRRRFCLCVLFTLSWISGEAGAAAQGRSSGAQATPLPLSGRAGQGGSVVATQTLIPGATASVDTINPTVQVQGGFAGSAPGARLRPFSGALSLQDAIQRGLEHNLGGISVSQVVRQAHGQRAIARSVLLPSIVADATGSRLKTNLAAAGITFSSPIPGFTFPTVVGPYNQVDFRARISQSLFDRTAWNNYRAAGETLRANELSVEDARDLVVLAVGAAYLQALADRARVQSGTVQLETANALYKQNSDRRDAGLVARLDVDRSQIQMLTQQQRLVSLHNAFAKQKINLARMVGLPPTDQYNLADEVVFAPAPAVTVDEALRQAREQRADLKALGAQVHAAERALAAARSERLPSVAVNADYGAIGSTPSDARKTFAIVGTVRVPIWQGGRTEGQIEQAEAVMAERRAELEDLGSGVEADIRKAYLDMQAATSQVDVALKNREISREALDLTRQRFDAGVSDNVEVVRAQESVATAELDYINSVYAHNVAKLSLARAMGQSAERVAEFLKVP